uniref:RNase H type-1 domain-containing protein n=1 Tax=Hordeum vulgare subsp. vulgare TaxID=112509 RepID=A0A8I6ZD60_HORVV
MVGMTFARQYMEQPIWVPFDSSTALSCLLSSSLDHLVYVHLIVEIKLLIINRVFIPQKLHRSQNGIADCMARYSRSERATTVWLDKGPHVLRNSCHWIVALPFWNKLLFISQKRMQ